MNIEYRALGYVLRSPAGAHNATCSVVLPRRIVLSASGVCREAWQILVYDAGGCCRLRSVAIGFVLLWGRDIGYASCVVSV